MRSLNAACGEALGSFQLFLFLLFYHSFVFFANYKKLFFNYFLAVGVSANIFGVDNGACPSVHLGDFFPGFRGDTGLSAACANVAHYTCIVPQSGLEVKRVVLFDLIMQQFF